MTHVPPGALGLAVLVAAAFLVAAAVAVARGRSGGQSGKRRGPSPAEQLAEAIRSGARPPAIVPIVLAPGERCYLGAPCRFELLSGYHPASPADSEQHVDLNLRHAQSGMVYLTDQRFVYAGAGGSLTVSWPRVLTLEAFDNGVRLTISGQPAVAVTSDVSELALMAEVLKRGLQRPKPKPKEPEPAAAKPVAKDQPTRLVRRRHGMKAPVKKRRPLTGAAKSRKVPRKRH